METWETGRGEAEADLVARLHKVEKRGALFYVIGLNGSPVGIGYARREDAEETVEGLRRSADRIIRVCMTCQKPFEADGPHNRMCPQCKRRG